MENQPGRGRKQCKACLIYVGVRSSKCPKCGHEFGKDVAHKVSVIPSAEPELMPVVSAEPPPPQHSFATVIEAPAGRLPVIPKSKSRDDVLTWIEELQNYGTGRHVEYSERAIIYFVGLHWPMFPADYNERGVHPDYSEVCNIVREHFYQGNRKD